MMGGISKQSLYCHYKSRNKIIARIYTLKCRGSVRSTWPARVSPGVVAFIQQKKIYNHDEKLSTSSFLIEKKYCYTYHIERKHTKKRRNKKNGKTPRRYKLFLYIL